MVWRIAPITNHTEPTAFFFSLRQPNVIRLIHEFWQLTNRLFTRIPVCDKTRLKGSDKSTQFQKGGHDAVSQDNQLPLFFIQRGEHLPFVESSRRAGIGIDIRELTQELAHGKDNGKNTLVETKEQTTHTGGEGGNQHEPTAEYILET